MTPPARPVPSVRAPVGVLLAALWGGSAHAADPVPEAQANDAAAAATPGWSPSSPRAPVAPDAGPAPGGLKFLGVYQLRAVASSVITTNPFLDGQLVGVLGGVNSTTVVVPGTTDLDGDGVADPDLGAARGVEQRALGFFTYAPPVLSGRAALTAGFEVDFTFGDSSYGAGGNVGGGYGGDQVNLQTRRMHATFVPDLGPDHELRIVTGLQFLADGVYDPQQARPDDLFRAGGGLRFFGSEAAGVSVFGRVADASGDRLRYRAAGFVLVENGIAVTDDVALGLLDLQWQPSWNGRLGAHAWGLRDRSGGTGGSVGVGPTSLLSGWQGGPELAFTDPSGAGLEIDADIVTLAVDAGLNHRLDRGPVGLSALGATQVGRLYVPEQVDVGVRGWLVDAEARWRWAPGGGSVVRLEGLASGRDGDGGDLYTGLITGNSYGFVGANWASHGCVLLLPDPTAINRQVAVVYDVSNGGQGLLAVAGDVGWDPVPDRWTVSVGGGHARSGFGDVLGTEVHGRVHASPMPLWRLGLTAAAVLGTDQPADPWTVFTTIDWVVF